MSTKDGGPAAFPHPFYNDNRAHDGMTLRDYFAGQALEAIILRVSLERLREIRDGIRAGTHEASIAYTLADAMLAERSR